ncbi:MAG: hypothetical protein KF861_19990 [Planctomycetaceae bacterium]|nr:hypothetical protein [Planctomycetaceae bacterium]
MAALWPADSSADDTGSNAVEWMERLIDLGTPLVVLLVFLRMLAQSAVWIAKNFVLPLRDSWLHHLKCLDEHLAKQTDMLCEILKRVECHNA